MQRHNWKKILSPGCEVEENRLDFISRMSYITFSQYLLYRGFVPFSVFKRRRIENVVIYTFNTDTHWGAKLSDMMKGMKEAIFKKYIYQAMITVNEDEKNPEIATEVLTITMGYNEKECFKIIDDQGHPIVSFDYKGEGLLSKQIKHMILKLSHITKSLQPFEEKATPYFKLTYYDHTPADYQPPYFKPCDITYVFNEKAPEYIAGSIATNSTLIVIDIKSFYIGDPFELDDLMLNEAGSKVNDRINPLDVTADSGLSTEGNSDDGDRPETLRGESFIVSPQSPRVPVVSPIHPKKSHYVPHAPPSPRGSVRQKRQIRRLNSTGSRQILKSPADETNY